MVAPFDWKLDLGERGILASGRWLWARAISWAALLFALAFVGLLASVKLSGWLKLPGAFDYVSAVGSPLVIMLLYAAAVRWGEKRRVTELALAKAPLELAAGGLTGAAFIAAILALLWSLGLYQVQFGHWKRWYDFFLFNAYVSGVLEELAFRAILLRIFARLTGPLIGLVISAALFGAAHAGHAPLAAVVQLSLNAGLIMGLLYMVSGRLWLSIGLHIGYDFTEWSILGVGDKSGLLLVAPAVGRSALLTGGDFGPDASILANAVGLLLALGILGVSAWRARRRRLATGRT